MVVILSIMIGGILVAAGWFVAKLKFDSEKGMSLSLDEIDKKYVPREMYTKLENDLQGVRTENFQKNEVVSGLDKEIARKEESIRGFQEKLNTQKKEIEELQSKLTAEFENIANRILRERSDQFLKSSKENISNLLNPLDIKISEFKTRIEQITKSDTEERASLKTEIKNLLDLNKQLSEDANNLASALKGENKTQGNWGEVQLDAILERVGLEKGVHYTTQESFETEEGRKQPDCIVYLPDNKHLIIDSKVSLTAFVNYFNAETDDDRKQFAVEHLDSMTGHIKELSKKNYQTLEQINPPDCVLMFVAYESALALAWRENKEIFQDAFDKNIILVTGSTLLATLKTVAFMWKQENQKKHVLEIAKQGGALYDKLVGFVEDLKKVGASMEQAKSAYDGAMNKLVTSSKKADTLIGRAERIRTLGAQTTKVLPQDILDQVEINEQEIVGNRLEGITNDPDPGKDTTVQ